MARLGWQLLLGALLVVGSAYAAPFGFRDSPDGATCRHFDLGTAIFWPEGQATWADADSKIGGDRPFDIRPITRDTRERVLRWDVTPLVRAWLDGRQPADGLIVRSVGRGPGGAVFHSREAVDVSVRPSLRVEMMDGRIWHLRVLADTQLDCSSYGGLGDRDSLTVGVSSAAVLRFDLEAMAAGSVRQAQLVLVPKHFTPWGDASLAVFRLLAPWHQAMPSPPVGLAAQRPDDRGLSSSADVMAVDSFDRPRLASHWVVGDGSQHVLLDLDEERLFWPLAGGALRTRIGTGEHLGLDLRLPLKGPNREEPEELFMRYYLRLAADWRGTSGAGKLPGLAGTYDRAGWGGRPWDGRAGWSARGAFLTVPAGHPAAGKILLGSYVYHGDTATAYGDVMSWAGGGGAALLVPDRWYCIEQQLKLNQIGRKDGVIRAWVDGRQVFERRGLQFRDLASIRIEQLWMNVYLGGAATARAPMHLYIDQLAVARRYIGPMPK